MKRFIVLMSLVTFIMLSQTACVTWAEEGVYQLQTTSGQLTKVIKPQDGWTYSGLTNSEYPWNIRTFTYPNQVQGSTKDNAAVSMNFSLTLQPPTDEAGITTFVQAFGLNEDERWTRMTAILGGQLNTEAKNAIVEHDAYTLLQNQEKVQAAVEAKLKEKLLQLTGLRVISVQIIGRPDFADDRIEVAASSVVANSKLKEASEAALAAARVDAEKKQVEAITFANPALFKIKMLELQLQIEQARAEGIKGHSGTLIMGSMPNLQMQFPAEK